MVVATSAKNEPLKHFCHPLPKQLQCTFIVVNPSDPFESLRHKLQESKQMVLVVEGHALNDRRVLMGLIHANSATGVVSPKGGSRAGAAIISSSEALLFETPGEITPIITAAIQNCKISNLDLSNFETYITNLRTHIAPFLLLVERSEHLKEAEQILRQTVHKGVNDFVARYIHPPLEFGAVRLLACTPVTPNQITIFWVILAGLIIPLFATGHLLTGIFLAALCGILDGIDGKLARLTLRFSKAGDLLDHVSNTIFDGMWYLALGWYFSKGDLNSIAANLTFILFISYCVERIVPGIFKKIHGVEIYDYEKIDRIVRLVGSRMNNNVWILMLGIILGFAQQAFYFVSLSMLATASWHTLRLFWVTWKNRIKKLVLIN